MRRGRAAACVHARPPERACVRISGDDKAVGAFSLGFPNALGTGMRRVRAAEHVHARPPERVCVRISGDARAVGEGLSESDCLTILSDTKVIAAPSPHHYSFSKGSYLSIAKVLPPFSDIIGAYNTCISTPPVRINAKAAAFRV